MDQHTSCSNLHALLADLPRYTFPCPEALQAEDGVYFIFEEGESAHSGDRIVRVGSHTGAGNLAARLREHLTNNKDRSIFRKNVGRALLNRDGDPFLAQWNIDLTTRANRETFGRNVDLEKQKVIEEQVSEYIRTKMSFCVVPVDRPLRMERVCIGTVSVCETCGPSSSWLGKHSPVVKIRESGLWQEQHLHREMMSEEDLDLLRGEPHEKG